jgi:hypothetical protein
MIDWQDDETSPREQLRHELAVTISRVRDQLVVMLPSVTMVGGQAFGLHPAITRAMFAAVVPFQVLPLRFIDYVIRIDAVLPVTPMTDLHLCRPTMRMSLSTSTILMGRKIANEVVRGDLVPFRSSFATTAKVLVRQYATRIHDEEAHRLHLLEPNDVLPLVDHIGWLFESKQECASIEHGPSNVWNCAALDFLCFY